MVRNRGRALAAVTALGSAWLLSACSVGLHGSTREAYEQLSRGDLARAQLAAYGYGHGDDVRDRAPRDRDAVDETGALADSRAAAAVTDAGGAADTGDEQREHTRAQARIHVPTPGESPSGLSEYLALAVERNPRLARARRNAEAGGYRIAQVTGLSDPMLTGTPPTGDMTQTAAGEVDWSVGITQTIPFPVKLSVRGEAASHAAHADLEAYRSTLLQVVNDVRRAYYQLTFADRALAITRGSRELLRSFRDIAARKYESGQVPQQDLLRAQVELANLDSDLLELEQDRATTQARLNRLMSRPVSTTLPTTAAVEPRRVELALDGLLESADDNSPEIAAARALTEKAEASLRLAGLDYVPDLTVGYRYTAIDDGGISPVANGDDSWQVMFGITVPIWLERLSAGRSEALARLDASKSALTDARDSIAYDVDEAVVKVQTQQRLASLFGDVIVPQARQTLDATISAYRAGQVDFLTLVANWRRLLDVEVAYHRSLAGFEQELAELERIVGTEVADDGTRS